MPYRQRAESPAPNHARIRQQWDRAFSPLAVFGFQPRPTLVPRFGLGQRWEFVYYPACPPRSFPPLLGTAHVGWRTLSESRGKRWLCLHLACLHPSNRPQTRMNKKGGWRGNRTPDTRIFNPLLYQLSYPAFERAGRMHALIFLASGFPNFALLLRGNRIIPFLASCLPNSSRNFLHHFAQPERCRWNYRGHRGHGGEMNDFQRRREQNQRCESALRMFSLRHSLHRIRFIFSP